MSPRKKRISPRPRNGIIETDAPHWRGDTARKIIRARVEAVRNAPPKGRRRSKSSSGLESPERRLKRLQRNLPKRKTLVARQRIEREIREIQEKLGMIQVPDDDYYHMGLDD